jgi:hypothetical protein
LQQVKQTLNGSIGTDFISWKSMKTKWKLCSEFKCQVFVVLILYVKMAMMWLVQIKMLLWI